MAGPVGSRPDLKRTLARNTYASGSIVETILPRDHGLKRLWCRLRVDMTVSSGASVITDNPMSLVKSIRISGTVSGAGSTTIKQASLTMLYWAAFFKRGTKPYRAQLASAGNQSNTILEVMVPIDFYATNLAEPGASILPCYAYKDLVAQVQWGTTTDLCASGVTINSAYIDFTTHELPGLTETEYARNIETMMTYPATTTGTDLQIFDLPLSGAYKSILLRETSSGAATRPGLNLLTGKVRVDLNGQSNIRLLDAAAIRQANAWSHGDGPSPVLTDAAGTRALSITVVEENPLTYLYWIDFAENMGVDGLIDASRLSSFKLYGDITTGGTSPIIEGLINRFEA